MTYLITLHMPRCRFLNYCCFSRQTRKVIHFAAFDSPHVTAALEAGGGAANAYYAVLLASAIDVAVAANANSGTGALMTNSAYARVQWFAITQDEPQRAFRLCYRRIMSKKHN